ncbi:glycerate kinase [Jeotgalibaca sp. MA1X17-3]|uniref:glycerate kinase family protein n=1 Tax=Jeotgalibaca sp. MA1X17-3 TaxID=2908211 RepID=UPI001F2AEC34|nr:glycerate kinase [Jeotgalibaca sp. MA1X17-3]UJF14897.1 glycerate kinase [Jeotgalibaca sp. MA1X17-3]
MKVLVAIDSFKSSLTSQTANQIVADTFGTFGHAVETFAISDGGEGFVSAYLANDVYQSEYIEVDTFTSYGKPMKAGYIYFKEEKKAIVEIALASGIQFNEEKNLHPNDLSSYGTGLVVKAAMENGAKKIIIGLGGTGTVDGGMGLLRALGVTFYNSADQELSGTGKDLGQVRYLDFENIHPFVAEVEFIAAADVVSKLTGPDGAVKVFGKQKGILAEELDEYEQRMKQYLKAVSGTNVSHSGDGAAGGVGFAIRHGLNGKIVNGFTQLSSDFKLEDQIKKVDLVITGEGQIDEQSLLGKVPVSISRIAQKYEIPVIAFVGSEKGNLERATEEGLSVIVPIVDRVSTLKEALENADGNLERAATRVAKLVGIIPTK